MKTALIGLGFGLSLAMLGIAAAGAGHGCYMPIGLFGAPFSALGILAGLIGAPALWTAVGWLARPGASTAQAHALSYLLAVHYLTGLLLISVGSYADRGYVNNVWVAALLGLVVYLAGQTALWLFLIRQRRTHAQP